MRVIKLSLLATVAAMATLVATTASALPFTATSGIEARGQADVDAFGPSPALSQQIETEVTEPFSRSEVSVADSLAGSFAYFASSDIGNLALRVSGTLTNPGTTAFFGGGVPILQAVAEARDLVTLTTARTDPFDVTLQLVVNGSLVAGSGSSIMANSLITLGATGQLSTSDSSLYNVAGPISETLSVTKTVSGTTVVLSINALLSTSVMTVAAGDTVSGQLANSAFINLILPSDVTIAASESGTFGVPIPVPEPATMLLSGMGLLVVVAAARHRRRAA